MQKIKKWYDGITCKANILVFLILMVASSLVFADKNFLSANNVVNILAKAARNGGMLAFGMTFVILLGQIDLSAGAVYAFSAVVMGLVGQTNPVLGLIAGLMTGVVTGAMIGFMVTKMRINSWIASLAMMFAVRGMITIFAQASVPIESEFLRFANTKFWKGFMGVKAGIPVFIPIFFALTFLCVYIGRHTRFGMGLYAAGGNKEAARMMGIDVDKITMKAFICSGAIASFSGVLLASSTGSATLSAGNVYETYAIAMCAIGGVKLSGGEGSFGGTFFGILIYFVLNTLFTYMPGLSVNWQSVIMGILVLISVALQSEVIADLKHRLPFKGSKKPAAS